MNRFLLTCFSVILFACANFAQNSIEVYTVYSENEDFYLQTIPFDPTYATNIGKTYVYKTGVPEPIYTIDKLFNCASYSDQIHLSNDGQSIFYVSMFHLDEEEVMNQIVTVYKNGVLSRSYPLSELSACNNDLENCRLLYRNEEAMDRSQYKWVNGGRELILAFQAGVSEEEQFATLHHSFSKNDTVYLIDQQKQVLVFDLRNGEKLAQKEFTANYADLKSKARKNKFEVKIFSVPKWFDFPIVQSGEKVEELLAKHLRMKLLSVLSDDMNKYKRYHIKAKGLICRNGNIEFESLDVSNELDLEAIRDFLSTQRFQMTEIPIEFEKWQFEVLFFLRKASNREAKKEKELENIAAAKYYQEKLTLDSIDGFYIPRNMCECFQQLDSLLKQKDILEMKALKDASEMILYHHGLGTYLRNNWGLWGGSRLQLYFVRRGYFHPDNMSGDLLELYYEWLQGNTEVCKKWEEEHPLVKE